MLISVNDYAKKYGKEPSGIRRKILRGTLHAVKIANVWLIDEDEPNTDRRFKDPRNEKKDQENT